METNTVFVIEIKERNNDYDNFNTRVSKTFEGAVKLARQAVDEYKQECMDNYGENIFTDDNSPWTCEEAKNESYFAVFDSSSYDELVINIYERVLND